MRYLLTGDIRRPGKIEVEAATLDQALDRADDGDFEVSDEQGKPLVFDWGGIAEDDHGNDVSDQASIPAEPQREVWYAWKERREVDGRMRLLTRWSNPEQHEHPFDLLFATPEAARVARKEYEADDEPWVLVRVTYQVSAAAGTLQGAWLHDATSEQIGALSDVSVREGRVPDELANALLVMVLNHKHRAWLTEHDPTALRQAEAALRATSYQNRLP